MSRHFSDAIGVNDLTDATDSDVEPEIEKTHWILPFAPVFRGKAPRRQMTACGIYIEATEHSTEPSCQTCADYLQREADNDAETAEGLGFEIKGGVMLPKESRP